jgi:hypothetical protein
MHRGRRGGTVNEENGPKIDEEQQNLDSERIPRAVINKGGR